MYVCMSVGWGGRQYKYIHRTNKSQIWKIETHMKWILVLEKKSQNIRQEYWTNFLMTMNYMLASELYKQIHKHKDELKEGWNHYDPDIDLESNSKLLIRHLYTTEQMWKTLLERHTCCWEIQSLGGDKVLSNNSIWKHKDWIENWKRWREYGITERNNYIR